VQVLYPHFVDHLVFRVAEIERTERFYRALLGEPLREDDYIMYLAGDTRLFFTRCVDFPQEAYDKEKIGLNHIALGVRAVAELRTVQAQLESSGIAHSGVKMWRDGVTQYIWLNDPDGIRVEIWLRPREE
jgi:glyoxylase I family protein